MLAGGVKEDVIRKKVLVIVLSLVVVINHCILALHTKPRITRTHIIVYFRLYYNSTRILFILEVWTTLLGHKWPSASQRSMSIEHIEATRTPATEQSWARSPHWYVLLKYRFISSS